MAVAQLASRISCRIVAVAVVTAIACRHWAAGGSATTEDKAMNTAMVAATAEVEEVEEVERAMAQLNRVTFNGNVITGDNADQWFVFFCVDWYDRCQAMRRDLVGLAHTVTEKLNTGRLFTNAIRFAEVDCGTDKVLCNEQDVETYPTVIHYRRGHEPVAWSSNHKSVKSELKLLTKWITSRLRIKKGKSKKPEVAVEGGLGDKENRPAALKPRAQGLVGLLAALAWLLSTAPEMIRTARAALDALRAASTAMKQKQMPNSEKETAPAEASEVAASRLVRCIPADWAEGRGSVEL